MTLPRPRTVRAKLTLFTMLVTGVLMALIVLVVDLGARRALLGAVDGEMLRQARGMSNGPRFGPGGPRGPQGPNRGPDDQGPRAEGERPDAFGPSLRNRQDDARGPTVSVRQQIGASGPSETSAAEEVHPLDFSTDPNDGERHAPYDPDAVAKARVGLASFSERELAGKTYRLYTFPIRRDGEIARIVQLPSELTSVTSALDRLRGALLRIVLPIGVLLAGLASLLLVDRFMRPLRQIAGEADRIGETDLAARLPVVGEDEFAGLSTTLNGMLGRLQSAFLRERGELARQRQFTADASHELKTPLAVIKANAGLMLHVSSTPEETREWAGEIDAATVRMTRLVNDMLVDARAEAGHSAHGFDLCDLREIAESARRALKATPETVQLDLPDAPVLVLGSSDELVRVTVNLAGNALKHSGATTPVLIAVRAEDAQAVLTVTDHGKGIAPEHLPHLFDRFYRVDASRSSEMGGTGLGLAIARGIVESHNGSIGVESELDRGSKFLLRLPLHSAERVAIQSGDR